MPAPGTPSCCGDGVFALLLRKPCSTEGRSASLPEPCFQGKGRRFVNEHHANPKQLTDFYDIGELKGSGAFGTVHCAMRRKTGKACVVKTMEKDCMDDDVFMLVANELEILSFCDHPHIIRLFHTFEDEIEVHCAMQVCTGGEVGERLEKEGPFQEHDAQVLMRQLLSGVNYLHSVHHLAHRDLKLENLLLEEGGKPLAESQVKIIDFGLAESFESGKMTDIVGTPGYIAPEVLLGAYCEKCDLFSCGVMLYEMLSGCMPFKVLDADDIKDAFPAEFYAGKLSCNEEPWQRVSGQAKLFAMQLCKAVPECRLSAQDALNSKWIKGLADEDVGFVSQCQDLKERLGSNLRQITGSKRSRSLRAFWVAALQHVAYNLEGQEIDGERHLFEAMDKDGNGTLTPDECANLCNELGMSEEESRSLLDRLPVDCAGSISYTEFLSGAIIGQKCSRDAVLSAFEAFDRDQNGKITVEELRLILGQSRLTEEELEEIIRQADQDQDGELDFEEFRQALPVESSPIRGLRRKSPSMSKLDSLHFDSSPAVRSSMA